MLQCSFYGFNSIYISWIENNTDSLAQWFVRFHSTFLIVLLCSDIFAHWFSVFRRCSFCFVFVFVFIFYYICCYFLCFHWFLGLLIWFEFSLGVWVSFVFMICHCMHRCIHVHCVKLYDAWWCTTPPNCNVRKTILKQWIWCAWIKTKHRNKNLNGRRIKQNNEKKK